MSHPAVASPISGQSRSKGGQTDQKGLHDSAIITELTYLSDSVNVHVQYNSYS